MNPLVITLHNVNSRKIWLMFRGFRTFIAQGNAVDLAIAVVLGTAFTAIVNAMVESVLMPLISGVIGFPNFDDFAVLMINGNRVEFGVLLTQVVTFLLIAAAVYYLVVAPMNKFIQARNAITGATAETAEEEYILLLRQIRDRLPEESAAGFPRASSTNSNAGNGDDVSTSRNNDSPRRS